MNLKNYRSLYFSESMGSAGSFGIDIRIAGLLPDDLTIDPISNAAYDAARKIEAEVRAAVIADDPKAKAEAAQERATLLALFPAPIFVETIPNGYNLDWHSRHLPWFVVTTTVGRFTIGWRKRVISIDWTQTVGTADSKTLFAAEDVTKEAKLIHAWSLDKAREYIAAIISSV